MRRNVPDGTGGKHWVNVSGSTLGGVAAGALCRLAEVLPRMAEQAG